MHRYMVLAAHFRGFVCPSMGYFSKPGWCLDAVMICSMAVNGSEMFRAICRYEGDYPEHAAVFSVDFAEIMDDNLRRE